MYHLSYTGELAGRRYCGLPRDQGQSYHATYIRFDQMRDQLCPVCREIYDRADDDTLTEEEFDRLSNANSGKEE